MNRVDWYGQNIWAWNPLAMLCSPASDGCAHCWHRRMAPRLAANQRFTKAERAAWAGTGPPVIRHPELDAPLRRKKPSIIAVQFMGDLFHESLEYWQVREVFWIMARAPHHTFLLLTKRPHRAVDLMEHHNLKADVHRTGQQHWPLPNVIVGVSVSTQADLDRMLLEPLRVPAAKRWLSIEPMLGPVDLADTLNPDRHCAPTPDEVPWRRDYRTPPRVDWVVVGGETGPGARPMNAECVRRVRDQCAEAGVPLYFKQWGAQAVGRVIDGRTWEQTPWKL